MKPYEYVFYNECIRVNVRAFTVLPRENEITDCALTLVVLYTSNTKHLGDGNYYEGPTGKETPGIREGVFARENKWGRPVLLKPASTIIRQRPT